jgi:hypothetical protein
MSKSKYRDSTSSHLSASRYSTLVFLIVYFAGIRASNAEMIHHWQNESPAIEWMQQANHSLFLADMHSGFSLLTPQGFPPFIDPHGLRTNLTNQTGNHSPFVVDGIGSAPLVLQKYGFQNHSTISDMIRAEIRINSSKELTLFFTEAHLMPDGVYKNSLQNTTE